MKSGPQICYNVPMVATKKLMCAMFYTKYIICIWPSCNAIVHDIMQKQSPLYAKRDKYMQLHYLNHQPYVHAVTLNVITFQCLGLSGREMFGCCEENQKSICKQKMEFNYMMCNSRACNCTSYITKEPRLCANRDIYMQLRLLSKL